MTIVIWFGFVAFNSNRTVEQESLRIWIEKTAGKISKFREPAVYAPIGSLKKARGNSGQFWRPFDSQKLNHKNRKKLDEHMQIEVSKSVIH